MKDAVLSRAELLEGVCEGLVLELEYLMLEESVLSKAELTLPVTIEMVTLLGTPTG